MGFFLVLKAEMVRNFIIMRRYWFATILGLIIGYGVLVMMIVAFLYNPAIARDSKLPGMGGSAINNGTLGLLIGMLAFGIVGMFSQGLQGMAQSGELEQLYMSPHGLITNFLARTMVASITSIFSMTLMLWLVDKTFSNNLHLTGFDILLLLAILCLTYVNLIGFGFMIGGLVLVFKQTGQAAMIVRFILMGIAIAATPKMIHWPFWLRVITHIVPVTDAAVCLKLVVIHHQGAHMFEPPYLQFLVFLLLNCFIWTALGVFCFKLMERRSRSKGTLGAY